MVKNPPANVGDIRDTVSVLGLEITHRRGNGNFSVFVWRISWTEEPGDLQSMGLQRVKND